MAYIVKRDGREVPFDKQRIIDAILAAFEDVDAVDDYAKNKASNIANYIEEESNKSDRPLTVEEIQDFVEHGLMATKKKAVARAYISYRNERTRLREHNSAFMQTIAEKIFAKNVVNQNANVDERSFGGRAGEANSELLRKFALDNLISKKAKESHLNNEIYIHDLDHYVLGDHNCLSIPFDKLLANGFNTRQTDVRPANSVNTAFQLVAVIFQLQSLQQFGGVSATHLDWTMVPYVRKSFYKHYKDGLKYLDGYEESAPFDDSLSIEDEEYKYNAKAYRYAMDMTIKEVYQAVEGMYHNLS